MFSAFSTRAAKISLARSRVILRRWLTETVPPVAKEQPVVTWWNSPHFWGTGCIGGMGIIRFCHLRCLQSRTGSYQSRHDTRPHRVLIFICVVELGHRSQKLTPHGLPSGEYCGTIESVTSGDGIPDRQWTARTGSGKHPDGGSGGRGNTRCHGVGSRRPIRVGQGELGYHLLRRRGPGGTIHRAFLGTHVQMVNIGGILPGSESTHGED